MAIELHQLYLRPSDDRIYKVIKIETSGVRNPVPVKVTLKMQNSRIFADGPEFTDSIAGFQKMIDRGTFTLIKEEPINEKPKKKTKKGKGN